MKTSTIVTRVLSVSLILALLLGLAILSLLTPSFAQSLVPDDVRHDTPGQVIKQGRSVHLDVELALVNVTVTDPYKRLVTGLEPDNFRIFEDNIEQEVVNFSSEDVPISIGVILDLSGSMANKLGKAKQAAYQFFKTANPQDEFFLVGFSEHAELLSPFTGNVEDSQGRLLSASAKGRTALLDAIYLGLSQMRGAQNGIRALLIISDGGDNNSRYNEKDIKRLVREADTQLYSIGIFDSFEYRSRTPEELNGPSLLSEMTDLNAGRAFSAGDLIAQPSLEAQLGEDVS